MKTLIIASGQPACGQTTLTVNLASGLSRKGYKVLIGDTGNNERLRQWLGFIPREDKGEASLLLEYRLRLFSSRLGIDLLELPREAGGVPAADYLPKLKKLPYDYLFLLPVSREDCRCLSLIADALIVCSSLADDELEEFKILEEMWRAARPDSGGIDLIIPNKINTKEWEHNIGQLSALADYFGYEHIADPIPV